MSKIEVNAIEPQCGTTLTIGASDTSIAGIGTVNWDTTKKTASFTAVSGRGYFVDSSSSAITVTLPASPSAGNIISVSDYNGSATTNVITIARNSSNINGDASDYDITKADSAITFVYVDATVGWTSVQTSNTADNQNPFMTATGGTVTECGDYKIHSFTGPGTFTVSSIGATSANNEVSYIVVAGGGGGGTTGGGGGGAGGFRESKSGVDCYSASPIEGSTPITVTATSFPITVGGGGAPSCGSSPNVGSTGGNGSPSTFSTITSTAGGGGGSRTGSGSTPDYAGNAGGSGGGAGRDSGPPDKSGAGNTPPVSPAQGFKGGPSPSNSATGAGGGGGATAAGTAGSSNDSTGPTSTGGGGDGGAGATTSITGSPVAYAGGGGGGINNGNPPLRGSGGTGGGGDGGLDGTDGGTCSPAVAGTTNTGGGGGGGSQKEPGTGSAKGGNGGSGIVIIRYKFQ